MIPTELTGSKFEEHTLTALERIEKKELGTFGRYGVQAVHTGKEWQIMQSLPDFEGIFGTRQIIFDCKVCTQASFPWVKYRESTGGPRSRQLRHLRKRSRFGVVCGFLLHWNARELKTKAEPAVTFWLPVQDSSPYWELVEQGEIKSLTREDCRSMGVEVPWQIHDRDRNHKLALEWLFSQLTTVLH